MTYLSMNSSVRQLAEYRFVANLDEVAGADPENLKIQETTIEKERVPDLGARLLDIGCICRAIDFLPRTCCFSRTIRPRLDNFASGTSWYRMLLVKRARVKKSYVVFT